MDLRVGREDAGDEFVGGSKVRRLQRELEKLKAGDEVTLKVYQGGGRSRDVKVKTVPVSDLPHRGSMSIFGGMPMAMPMPPMEPMELFGRMLPTPATPPTLELRRNLEDAVREPLARLAPAIRRIVTNRIII